MLLVLKILLLLTQLYSYNKSEGKKESCKTSYEYILKQLLYSDLAILKAFQTPPVYVYINMKNCAMIKGGIRWLLMKTTPVRGIRGIFFRGAKSFFIFFFQLGMQNCFFSVENFHFGRPKTKFSSIGKQKKKSPLLIL